MQRVTAVVYMGEKRYTATPRMSIGDTGPVQADHVDISRLRGRRETLQETVPDR